MFIKPIQSIIRLEVRGCILLLDELLMLGKTILICLIKDIYFIHIVVFIMKLWEVASVLSPEISTDISIPGSVCPFCLSPHWSEKAPSCSLLSQHSQDMPLGSKHGASGHMPQTVESMCVQTHHVYTLLSALEYPEIWYVPNLQLCENPLCH